MDRSDAWDRRLRTESHAQLTFSWKSQTDLYAQWERMEQLAKAHGLEVCVSPDMDTARCVFAPTSEFIVAARDLCQLEYVVRS